MVAWTMVAEWDVLRANVEPRYAPQRVAGEPDAWGQPGDPRGGAVLYSGRPPEP